MASEREELTFKNGATIVLTNGEDGYTVNITGFDEPMMGTYNDIKKLTEDIGEYLREKYLEMFKEDEVHFNGKGVYKSPVSGQDKDIYKLSVRLRRINPDHLWYTYAEWLWGDVQHVFF